LLDGQQTVVDTVESAYEVANSAYLEACPYDIMARSLLPTYKSWFSGKDSFVKRQDAARAAFETA